MSSIAAARSIVEAGQVRRIAITSARRFRGLPDLPTVSETLPGAVLDGFFAVVGPAGMPPESRAASTIVSPTQGLYRARGRGDAIRSSRPFSTGRRASRKGPNCVVKARGSSNG